MKRWRLVVAVVAGLVATGLVLAAPASAHVTVSSTDATPGGEAVVVFKVPTESDTASTTGLRVQLPTATPFTTVLVQPQQGWSFTTKMTRLTHPVTTDDGDQVSQAVSEIDWTADSAATAIKPGEFDQFVINAGPLPNVPTITFKAIQIYSDGTQVNWTEVPAPGSTAEPDHPAPTLQLTHATTPDAAAGSGGSSGGSSQTVPIVLSSIALALAAAALGLSLLRSRLWPVLRRRRS